VRRYVLVQPSFYGTDNSYIFQGLEALGDLGRAVVVVDPDNFSPNQIDCYARRGVCGIRVNQYSRFNPLGANPLEDVVSRFMAQLPSSGWHLEVIAPLPKLIQAAGMIGHATVPIVIDHYGLPEDVTPESDTGRCLLDLLALPHVWIKLSAPYRTLPDPLATRPPAAWLEAFLQAAPDRCVWGSDWPHPPLRENQTDANQTVPYRPLDYARLFGDFLDAIPSAEIAERVLFANPMRLYGFSPAQNGGK
jgi:predicted TIM-barrel fold metal-dependent hydrolase